jgi:hypothetical protein
MLKVKLTNCIVLFISTSAATRSGCSGKKQFKIWCWQLPPPYGRVKSYTIKLPDTQYGVL